MIKSVISAVILLITGLISYGQAADEYQVYALRFDESGKIPVRDIAVGTMSTDSVSVCNMFWYLKDSNGRNVIVDAGFIDTTGTGDLGAGSHAALGHPTPRLGRPASPRHPTTPSPDVESGYPVRGVRRT